MVDRRWYNFRVVMRTIILVLLACFIMSSVSYAGLYSGDASGIVQKRGELAAGAGGSITMFGTPFSSITAYATYALTDNLNIFGRTGGGAVDYTSTTLEATTGPTVYAAGAEYRILGGPGSANNLIILAEHEIADWAVDGTENKASCTTIGLEMIRKTGASTATKIRFAVYALESGDHAGPSIVSRSRYGVTTENRFDFSEYMNGHFEGGIFFGDEEGMLVMFGTGIGFNLFK